MSTTEKKNLFPKLVFLMRTARRRRGKCIISECNLFCVWSRSERLCGRDAAVARSEGKKSILRSFHNVVRHQFCSLQQNSGVVFQREIVIYSCDFSCVPQLVISFVQQTCAQYFQQQHYLLVYQGYCCWNWHLQLASFSIKATEHDCGTFV